ncbi:ABC transporter permease [Acidaminobacter hydrogenoformans]|uniref:Oligopeptide transport system permease protein n=1 Tax=Acidaminobacter hydrogenoformans DSM 2784 TaxID=1120920 RepID=A0A1G5RXP0_9FIRM|nr:ABC transporter permease [Acidaminobacter hydrogenoformans]SCZ78813.1 oligopeptide transport system permease protein [Acidaminobacter hydrogenoformans DSM 2784]
MIDQFKTTPDMWEPIILEDREKDKIVRKSLTYWQDAWRRLKKNHLSMLGLGVIILLAFAAIVGPVLSPYSYSDQDLNMSNMPPRLELHKLDDGTFVHVHKEYRLYEVTENGELIGRVQHTKEDMVNKVREFELNGNEIVIDYKLAAINKDVPNAPKFTLTINGQENATPDKTVWNKTYLFGTDTLGRDIFVRNLYGARISLLIALVATIVQFFIGVIYGGVSGYVGGRVDNFMMRVVDIVDTIPLMLYVILLMVVLGAGLMTIIIALGSVYWVRMARLVRGQVLSIKENEFILAARTLGASPWRIMVRHLIPNSMGAIIVSLAMMVPSAIFTESFLSFIGLGVSAPQASWGTLASDAMGGLRTYAYQLFVPSFFISMTVLSFNFLGDGLRDALDPRLRK